MNSNSCIETPAAPEWLSKLESRREALKRTKLGHEAGAGAPCAECGDKCPGLDLHFWRKVCRNCKCRKDQHMCNDDDLFGWAQFEILGQIRSKPAFIKIKALASQPVQLEWVPPNAAPDVISDYMEKLDATQIPVAGSEAAQKRKQQLEFQVPPHDLDAALCDNLSESEANQLQLYVQRIRENCVGQGSVVRVGQLAHARVGHLGECQTLELPPVSDAVLDELMANEKVQAALLPASTPHPDAKLLVAFATPICEDLPASDETAFALLSTPTRQLLRGLNRQAVQSLVQHAPVYDKIFATLQRNQYDVSRDPRLGPMSDFRMQYASNARTQQEIDAVLDNARPAPPPRTPLAANELKFSSPLPLKSAAQARMSAHMRQDTPMRKVRFGSNTAYVVRECALPPHNDYERDSYFADLLAAEPLKQALMQAGAAQQLVLTDIPRSPPELTSEATKDALGLDAKALQSLLVNLPYYDTFFETLAEKRIDCSQCPVLAPLQNLRLELQKNQPLRAQLGEWLRQQPDNRLLAYEPLKCNISNSQSSDSGFESKPSTPKTTLEATAGRFACIPGIEDMPMYPAVESTAAAVSALPQALHGLQLSPTPSVLECRDCAQPLALGEVAVKAERAGRGMAWHPACFKCHTCRELLADLVYFFHSGQVYCGRDLAIKLKIPRCKACDELIFTKEYTAAEGAAFHIKHFSCYHCDEPLAGQQYVPDEKTNMPLCLKCYEQFFAAACQRCAQPIGPADQGVALGDIHWHGGCFICAGLDCGKSLIGGRFCVKQKMAFCSPSCVRSIIH